MVEKGPLSLDGGPFFGCYN